MKAQTLTAGIGTGNSVLVRNAFCQSRGETSAHAVSETIRQIIAILCPSHCVCKASEGSAGDRQISSIADKPLWHKGVAISRRLMQKNESLDSDVRQKFGGENKNTRNEGVESRSFIDIRQAKSRFSGRNTFPHRGARNGSGNYRLALGPSANCREVGDNGVPERSCASRRS